MGRVRGVGGGVVYRGRWDELLADVVRELGGRFEAVDPRVTVVIV